ncbi:fibronectin/fibrinogen-binding protein [Sporosarcina sp. PTS2304]|uniref:Rqc2 family fibronectin-binding protein n=1 Tax=Sporosarcina sp. PTS2304 TaxID=2283194 RepID=UPI000E0CD927|nr:NFACT RNA binding domain-containing protein [Sporosarcina sp. PTS2304]AXH98650.1 fibronectin/fibrinogen-binding protein [Sporosarcina sp. PTS2304]
MAFDGLFTKAMVSELQQLKSGRISKIHQPNSQEVVFQIRSNNKNHKLLVSLHPSYSRIQLTNEILTNPAEPPLFCMVLRKQLEGGLITSIEQHETDRVVTIHVQARNELGDQIERQLVVEIMGRHSNLILLDASRDLIIDSMKHLPPSVNSYRTILPGQPYIPAPAQDKVDPFSTNDEDVMTILGVVQEPKDIVRQFAGFSPLTATELLYRLQQDSTRWLSIWKSFLDSFSVNTMKPMAVENERKTLFSAIELTHVEGTTQSFETLGDLLDKVYFARAERERVKSQAIDLERWLSNEISKLENKMKKLEKEQQTAQDLDTLKLYGELLTANSYMLHKGDTEVTVDNYYEQGTTVTIPLDPRKTPIDNAQKYFSRYSKAKTALIRIAEQLEKTKDDIEYFEMVRQQVYQASPIDIEEIREELVELGFMRARKSKKKIKSKKPSPESFMSSAGIAISVGKNNKQNDYVTFKVAARDHIWLHTKDIPGSHVVIHDANPDAQTIEEAATLSAYFSKARESSSVPVDYTAIRHVKKPSGAKPGFVIYFEQKTVFVTPDEDLVRKLRK